MEDKNYFPFIIVNGEEHVFPDAMNCADAVTEALRHKEERQPEVAGVKVFNKDRLRILSWKEGKYVSLQGAYLYQIIV